MVTKLHKLEDVLESIKNTIDAFVADGNDVGGIHMSHDVSKLLNPAIEYGRLFGINVYTSECVVGNFCCVASHVTYRGVCIDDSPVP